MPKRMPLRLALLTGLLFFSWALPALADPVETNPLNRDPKVREAIRQQKTIVSIDPQAQAALDAHQIAEALIRGGAESIAEARTA